MDMKVAVIGAGAWGTTLAWMIARNGHHVGLWARRPELAEEMARTRRNRRYRPEISLPDQVTVSADLGEALDGGGVVVMAVPSHGVRAVLEQGKESWPAGAVVLSAVKGLERASGMRMSEVIVEVLGGRVEAVAALSGPNLSEEIARGAPAAAVVASENQEAAVMCRELVGSEKFRVYTNPDIVGVELCGALKNVIALAAGMSDGLGYGENAKAALITRGLVEMAAVVQARGGDLRTCWGLAGVGDLVATCHSRLSRNWTLGYHIGRGERLQSAAERVRGVAEGVYTSAAIVEWAREKVDLPIAKAVRDVVHFGMEAAEAARRLMTRPWRSEM